MSEATLRIAAPAPGRAPRAMFVRVAWRNLWRHRLRTWMSAAGLAFAIFLVSFFVAMQAGSYGGWIETATSLMVGHLQVQHPDYHDNPRTTHTVPNATELVRRLEKAPGVAGAAPRAEAFALAAAGERSFGALVMGVDATRERAMFLLPKRIVAGEYLPRANSAFLGTALAANLGIQLGDEITALGSSEAGGVAALVLTVDGTFETGQPELDRSIMQVPLAAMQNAFEMGDSVHRVVLNGVDVNRLGQVERAVAELLPPGARLLNWQELLPELKQGIQLDRISAQMIYWLLMIVVTMSVVNAFIMTVFERTREFGMLLAIGMKPNAIVAMLIVEALCVWALGVALGVALCVAAVLPVAKVGIPAAGMEGMEEMAAQMMLPERIYPLLEADAFVLAPLAMLVGTLVAALIPALRVRRMQPVEALREEE